jgi:uncharacterized OsmC-like protein
MRILFDHGTPRPLRAFLRPHVVVTAAAVGCESLKNGLLLEAAEKNAFDILITTDKNMRFQQNLRLRRIGIIVLENGKWPDVKIFVPKILEAINEAKPGVCIVVACFEA